MVAAAPEAYVATMSKAKRTGRIFIDYFRNDYTATAIADYAVRARPGRARCPADRLERTEGSGIGQSIYDERCSGTIEEDEEVTACAFAPDHSGTLGLPTAIGDGAVEEQGHNFGPGMTCLFWNQTAAARTWSKLGLRKVWRSTAPAITWAEPPAVMNFRSFTPMNPSIACRYGSM